MARLSFSQRNNYVPKEFPLQTESLNNATRMALWNAFYQFFSGEMVDSYSLEYMNSARKWLCTYIWANHFHQDLSLLDNTDDIVSITKKMFLDPNTRWYAIFDFCENILYFNSSFVFTFGKLLDEVFEDNNVAYRVIGSQICPITDSQEIETIKTAMSLPDQFAGARTHIASALQKFSDREQPDYRNSIKESISAVESMCMVLVGSPNASLGKALKLLEDNGIKIHPSLKSGFSSIYGYTSDEGGIRHAMIEEGSSVTQEDALFMLVSCSAFCHYLQQKGSKAGIV